MEIYTGSQPATADSAKTGAPGRGHRVERHADQGDARHRRDPTDRGASGSINTLLVGGLNVIPDGAVPFNTSLNQTAADLCGRSTATASWRRRSAAPR